MIRNNSEGVVPSSFRDPCGFLFYRDGTLYRHVAQEYQDDFELLLSSGLYDELVARRLLIPHQVAPPHLTPRPPAYRVLEPERIPFISYPYEWSFTQLKGAALATLAIQKEALRRGMCLKDATAFNIQFRGNSPVLIDTLSFERYQEGRPWVAYRQFCQHFLAPLALMAFVDVDLGQLSKVYIDGVPLALASRLLPVTTRLRPSLLLHVYFHARAQRRLADAPIRASSRALTRNALMGMIESLDSTIRPLNISPTSSTWVNYYDETMNYTDASFADKEALVSAYLDRLKPKRVWDLGANTGHFSRIAASHGAEVIAFDSDPLSVDQHCRYLLKNNSCSILPLVLDLANPTPSIGWHSAERLSLLERGPTETVLALALIHHLAIGNNVPFEKIAAFFGQLCKSLIIEFVPKHDPQLQKLLVSRRDIFTEYTQEHFEAAFALHFRVSAKKKIAASDRALYLMEKP